MDDLPKRVDFLKWEAAQVRANFLQAIFRATSTSMRLAETEHRIGDRDAALKFLRRAEDQFAKALQFLSSPAHRLADGVQQDLIVHAEFLRIQLGKLQDLIALDGDSAALRHEAIVLGEATWQQRATDEGEAR